MILICGIHGVGKSYFCDKVKAELGLQTYSASALITERKKSGFSSDKLIPDIDDNQQYLLSAIQDLNNTDPLYLLDGHFCLLNARGRVTRIPEETFTALNPDAIVLLTESPEVIAERRRQRDGIEHSEGEIREFQNEEIAYAKEIAEKLDISMKVSMGAHDLADTLRFVQATIRRVFDGRQI